MPTTDSLRAMFAAWRDAVVRGALARANELQLWIEHQLGDRASLPSALAL